MEVSDRFSAVKLTTELPQLGQKAPVEVAIQFQYRRFRRGLLSVRYSASKLTP